MKRDIILAGVGGQGLLALAAIIGEAATRLGLHVKQAEVHGMAQRGGVVQSHLRFADRPIPSPLVPEGAADLILSLEPMEALRYLPYMAPDGAIVASSAPFVNIPDYPEATTVLAELEASGRARLIDAPSLAKEAGALQAANIVMLGAGAPFLEIAEDALLDAVDRFFAAKGKKVIDTNRRAFRLGLAASRSLAASRGSAS